MHVLEELAAIGEKYTDIFGEQPEMPYPMGFDKWLELLRKAVDSGEALPAAQTEGWF